MLRPNSWFSAPNTVSGPDVPQSVKFQVYTLTYAADGAPIAT